MENRSKMVDLLKSRKFWAALVGLALVMIKPFAPEFPVAEDQVVEPIVQLIGIATIVVSYIVGTAIEDAGRLS